MLLLNVGFGNAVVADKIVAVLIPGSNPVKRLVQKAREENRLLDATCGRKTRSVIVTDGGFVVLSALLPKTIYSRLEEAGIKITVRGEQ